MHDELMDDLFIIIIITTIIIIILMTVRCIVSSLMDSESNELMDE